MQCSNYSIDLPDLADGEQYHFHFDATASVGCHYCEVACNEQNANPDEIKWRRVGEMEMGKFPDTLQLNHCIERYLRTVDDLSYKSSSIMEQKKHYQTFL